MKKYIVVGATLWVTSTAAARPPVPAEQWTSDARLWLARAMIAEAGWRAPRDHAAIAHVLARRWRRVVERYETIRFVDVIRNYCSGLGGLSRSPTRRQRWVRRLWPDGSRPEGWPDYASWDRHAPLWRHTLARADRFGRGELRDPCRGRAWHWGGTIDSPRGRMQPVNCGDTQNTFYGLAPRELAAAD
ncbi:MAG: hypothetical protein PVI30_09430 [Myxococcales bacterium]|jgi:hypothetical protein